MRAQRNVATRRSLLSLTAALAAAGLAGCGSVPQAEAPRQAASARPALSENADGSVEHIPSGMKFPALVGSFIRGKPRAYDAQGMNVSAGYDGPQAVTITVYVYPIEAYGNAQSFSAKAHFEDARNQIAAVRRGMRIISEQEVPPPRRAVSEPGLFGRYEFFGSDDGGSQPMESLLYVYAPVARRWIVKYRVSYPKDSLDARTAVGRFMESFGWALRAGP